MMLLKANLIRKWWFSIKILEFLILLWWGPNVGKGSKENCRISHQTLLIPQRHSLWRKGASESGINLSFHPEKEQQRQSLRGDQALSPPSTLYITPRPAEGGTALVHVVKGRNRPPGCWVAARESDCQLLSKFSLSDKHYSDRNCGKYFTFLPGN